MFFNRRKSHERQLFEQLLQQLRAGEFRDGGATYLTLFNQTILRFDEFSYSNRLEIKAARHLGLLIRYNKPVPTITAQAKDEG